MPREGIKESVPRHRQQLSTRQIAGPARPAVGGGISSATLANGFWDECQRPVVGHCTLDSRGIIWTGFRTNQPITEPNGFRHSDPSKGIQ